MSTKDEIYIRRCFQLALRAGNKVKANPNVGAVLVFGDMIIGEGYHEKFGGLHAESNALRAVAKRHTDLIPGSCLYVSLEPCNHVGKTGPCTELILEKKISRVRISCLDPNPKMNGKSVVFLREKGVDVKAGILKEEGSSIIRPFECLIRKSRPYIILKFAQSKDGFMGIKDRQVWLSNPQSRVLSHKWRTEVDGILIGVNTLNTDNPELTARNYPGPSPVRILIDPHDRRTPGSKILCDGRETWVFTYRLKKPQKKTTGLKIIEISDSEPPLPQILKYILNQGIFRLLVEGGANTLEQFVKDNLWDEARIIRTPNKLGAGLRAPTLQGKLARTLKLSSDEVIFVENN